jgi:hypothetical protein
MRPSRRSAKTITPVITGAAIVFALGACHARTKPPDIPLDVSPGAVGVWITSPLDEQTWPTATALHADRAISFGPTDMIGWGKDQAVDTTPMLPLLRVRPSARLLVRGDADQVLASISLMRDGSSNGLAAPKTLSVRPRAQNSSDLLQGMATLPAEPGQYEVSLSASWPSGEAVFSFRVDIRHP